MRKLTSAFLATATVMLCVIRLHAQQSQYVAALHGGSASTCNRGGASHVDFAPSCRSPNCGQSGFIFQHELTMFRYHKNQGIPASNEFDFKPASRITLGYRGPDGLGVRARYWKYDHKNLDHVDRPASVDTYNVDVEFFEEIEFSCHTSVEFSGGFRYNDFLENNFSHYYLQGRQDRQTFSGGGGIIAIQANRKVGPLGLVYGRVRQAILMSDWQNADVAMVDTVQGMTELGLGGEYTLLCRGRYSISVLAGFEWQMWHNYEATSTYDDVVEPSYVADAGFGGFVFGITGDF